MIPTLYLLAQISCLFLIILFAVFYLWANTFGVPFVPSDRKIVNEMVAFLKRTKVKRVAELGAGDGRVAFALARDGFIVTAVEVNPLLSLWMRAVKYLRGYSEVEIINKDLFKIDIKQFDAIIVYLYPEHLEKLEEKFFSQMPKGGYILSNTFTFKKHKPLENSGKLYIYQVAK
jgi:16S rRNA A1518/A1519 N6-dimethyltransferase RsmA/KsgA/DIM1 with predicted DNA glycosylase/AP lyase activity